jgi:hypothetical protein
MNLESQVGYLFQDDWYLATSVCCESANFGNLVKSVSRRPANFGNLADSEDVN